jgi:uncharacterized membrane protein
METVLQYEIPVLHPLAVHFPVALLVAAAGFAVVWAATGHALWRRVSAAALFVGTAGAAFAYFTGEAMKELSEDIPIVEDLVGLHENLALATLLVSVAMSIVACLIEWRRRRSSVDASDSVPFRVIVLLGFIVVAALVLVAGHVGGIMVWGVAR